MGWQERLRRVKHRLPESNQEMLQDSGFWNLFGALYAAWTAGEALLGLGMSAGLVFAASTLLADADHHIESGWKFVWYVLCINCALSVFSAATAVPLLCCLPRKAEARGMLHSAEEQQVIGAGDEEVAEIGRIAVEIENAEGEHASPRKRKAWRWFYVISGAICCSCLVGCTAVFLMIHAFPPGHSLASFQACAACFCKENISADVFRLTRDVVYGQAAGSELLLDVYAAEKPLDNGTSPAIVMIHGGNFMAGSKSEGPVVDEAYFFASSGFVAFSIDYQLESDNYLAENQAVRDAVHNAKAAVRFVRKNAERFGVDAAHIAVWGESAGAIVAASMNSVSTEGASGTPGVSSQVAAALGLSGTIWPFLVAMPGNDAE
ncbi:pnbA, partial [Symbiodinium sp. KB8]